MGQLAAPILFGGHAEAFLKDAVEIAHIVVADTCRDVGGSYVGMCQQILCLRQSFFLQKRGKGSARLSLDLAGEPVEIVVQLLGDLGKGAALIVFFDEEFFRLFPKSHFQYPKKPICCLTIHQISFWL